MGQKRPTPVLVIAILHFTFGGLSLFFGLCGLGAQLAMQAKVFPQPPSPPPGRPQAPTQDDIQKYMDQRIPHHQAMLYGGIIFDLCLSVLMIIAGLGLIQMRSWGRILSIGYACLSIVQKLVGIIYAFLVTLPVMNEFLDTLTNQAPETVIFVKTMRITITMTPILQLSYLVYPIVVLVVMYLPTVSAAFRGQTLGMDPADPYVT